ncbi:TolB family protein [Clostridium beijerinckii]|uniref:TolB family protein n=1 Tax=Clostridium beijerinckii TaxID=1520 RepID=UPI00098C3AB6|nr:hypothetical protein [Clostridium beijerinckii]MBA8933564.1 hypothetical protein [Clostridium beijerinckii]NRU37763.1 hypothetical protein [Clostridium beijerinckii]NSA98959.1 hypothetical protein [Clostridium beijerinckii]OOM55617.1 protein TolB [Clostridium beijerinckii]OOM72544.1 protein TolB [Clostridium beijerinckii]
MKRVDKLRKYNNYTVMLLIFGVFVSAFYCLNHMYALESKIKKLVLLDQSLFSTSSLLDEETNTFKVEKVSKLDLEREIYNFQKLEDNYIAFTTTDAENNDVICTLNLSKDTLKEDGSEVVPSDKNKLGIDNLNVLYKVKGSSIGKYNVSEDGKKIIFFAPESSLFDNGNVYLYDVDGKKLTQMQEKSYINLIIGNNKYIGINDEYLFVKNLDSGKIDNLKSTKDIISSNSNRSSKNKGKYNLLLSANKEYACLIALIPDGDEVLSHIYQINLENEEISEEAIQGSINKVVNLLDGNFIFSGQIEGENGIFIYNIQTKNYKNLVQGNISDVDITDDNKRISYIDTNNDGSSKIHVGSFDKDKIMSDTVIYNDPKYGLHTMWSNDGNKLYYFSFYDSGTRIYGFSLNG